MLTVNTAKLRKQVMIRARNILYQKAKLSGSKNVHNRFVTLKHSIQKDLQISYWRYVNNQKMKMVNNSHKRVSSPT